jgi:hypothetical protein
MGMRRWLLLVMLAGLASALTYWLAHRPEHGLHRVVSAIPAEPFHAVIFRYDTELSSPAQLEALMRQDAELGLVSTAFPLAEDLQSRRNHLHRFATYQGELQMHGRPMPRGLSNAFQPYGDPTSYQYDYLDQDRMLQAFIANLLHEVRIFRINGIPLRGFSLHANSNRLPWSDEINYRIFAATAAALDMDWVSVTSSQFSLGATPGGTRPELFNAYDRAVTVAQKPLWISYRTGLFQAREVLAIATSWRDRYRVGLRGQEDWEGVYEAMNEDIDRQWAAAREQGVPLVLLLHPTAFAGKSPQHELSTRLKRRIAEQARREQIPIMTFSQYHDALAARR